MVGPRTLGDDDGHSLVQPLYLLVCEMWGPMVVGCVVRKCKVGKKRHSQSLLSPFEFVLCLILVFLKEKRTTNCFLKQIIRCHQEILWVF